MSHRTFQKLVMPGLLIMAVLLPMVGVCKQTANCPENVQQYWGEVRAAILQSDYQKLATLVHFPLEVRGTLDDSEPRKIDRESFSKILPDLLANNPGLSAEPSTMRTLIEQTKHIPASSCNKYGNQFRIGSWVFGLKNDQWQLVQAFIDE